MRKCPVHNCPAKTGSRIAVIVAAVMALIAVAAIVLHFVQQCKCEE